MDHAACAGLDYARFFDTFSINPAVKICALYAVRVQCLDFAISNEIESVVWGGTSGIERTRLRRDARPHPGHKLSENERISEWPLRPV